MMIPAGFCGNGCVVVEWKRDDVVAQQSVDVSGMNE